VQLTIIGAGAIGGTLGAHLIRSGHQVLFCDADVGQVEAINLRGLTIEGPVENFSVQARAVTPDDLPAALGPTAIAVKGHHTAQAAELVRSRLAPDAYVVSFQNGLSGEILAAAVGRPRVILAMVNFGADVVEPGRILQGNVATVRVGEIDGGAVSPRVRQLAEALPYAQATGNIMGYLWAKEAYGAMLWAGAVSDLSIADSLADPRWHRLMISVAREVLAQAPVGPESFDGFDPADLDGSLGRLAAFNRNSGKSHSGIYRDLMVRRRKTEVDSLLRDLKGPLTTSTAELIQAIERGERTCEVANLELLATYERTRRLGSQLDALVNLLPVPARRATGPLHGVAVAVKDLIDVAGTPRGNGNPRDMASPPAGNDAAVVTALRQAGAEVYATTALLEYAAGATHPLVPETRNPYAPGRTAGGSSGGSAALVGAGACSVALGTDTGGSIRIPAHYCGIVGFKPSFGTLDMAGVQPLAPSLDHLGLLAANVGIAVQVFAAIAGTQPVPAPAGLRVGLVSDQLGHPAIDAEVSAALAGAVESLRGACVVIEVDGAPFALLDETFDAILLWEAWQVHGRRVEDDPDHFGPETLRLLQGASKVTRAAYQDARRRRDELLAAAGAAYAGVDVLLTPAGAFVAPETTPPVDTPQGAIEGRFTRAYNLTGAPAVVLPCGWSDRGLPIGLQLSAGTGADMALLAASGLIEAIIAFEPRIPAVK
jgi:2-dehydropantoate 2-reductase